MVVRIDINLLLVVFMLPNPSSNNATPLPRIYAWFSGILLDDFALLQDLLVHGMPIDIPHPLRHTTALMEASRLGRTAMVEWLLNHGAAPAFLNGLPQGTALHCALRYRHWEVATLLVNRSHAPGVVDSYGRTPLHTLCADIVDDEATVAAMDIINLLVGKGCPLDVRDNEGITSLHYTVINDNRVLTELLLVHTANPNVQTPDRLITPLMIAALEKNLPIASLLLQHGADPHLCNADGMSAIGIFPELQKIGDQYSNGHLGKNIVSGTMFSTSATLN